tara:strand:+ start:53 stop:490 length:438 start_codon:yes stop_codon:yes gene_type:complete
MNEKQLELSDEQREEVRQMLSKFGNKKAKQKEATQQQDINEIDPDPLEFSPPGSTIEWGDLTPKTRRYSFVRETRARFVPYILDMVSISTEELNILIKKIGMDVTSQNSMLTVCSITQADPIRVFHIQTCEKENKLVIEAIRYIV